MDLIMGMLFMGIFFIYRLRVPKTSWGTFYYVWWVAAYQCFLHGAGYSSPFYSEGYCCQIAIFCFLLIFVMELPRLRYMLSSPLLGWGDWDSALKDVPNALYYKYALFQDRGPICDSVCVYF